MSQESATGDDSIDLSLAPNAPPMLDEQQRSILEAALALGSSSLLGFAANATVPEVADADDIGGAEEEKGVDDAIDTLADLPHEEGMNSLPDGLSRSHSLPVILGIPNTSQTTAIPYAEDEFEVRWNNSSELRLLCSKLRFLMTLQ